MEICLSLKTIMTDSFDKDWHAVIFFRESVGSGISKLRETFYLIPTCYTLYSRSLCLCGYRVSMHHLHLLSKLLDNRGFAQRGTHLRTHDISKSLGFLLHSAVWRKTTKNAKTSDLPHGRIWNFIRVSVLTFLSLVCNLVMWYELIKK